ncbi:hypothetical protein CsSME_00016105 [Camellia sinensis var. sinensis]
MFLRIQNPFSEVDNVLVLQEPLFFIFDLTGPLDHTYRSVLMERYELGRLLGQGTFAKVYYARNLKTGESVKEKVLRVELVDQMKREISVMTLVKHPNIVQLYEVMATKTKITLSLNMLKELKEDVVRKYFQQLIKADDFCHSRGVYHRDLKPENLLLDENENLKVSDYGLSGFAESNQQDGLLHTTFPN